MSILKKLFLWSTFLLFYVEAIAQNPTRSQFYELEPDVLIQGETLAAFPGTDINEMLLGRIPGLNAVSFDKNESPVTYVVDGLVWASIEGLSIHNIESIAYYRGGLNHHLGIQHAKPNGVIYIKTKQPSYKQSLQTDLDALGGINIFNESLTEGKYRVLQGYNLALSQGTEQLSWRGSVGYNRAGRNRYQQDYSGQYQFNGGLRYQPARWIEFAFNFNYAPTNGKSAEGAVLSTIPDRDPEYYFTESKDRNDWSGAFSATINFGGGWVNQTSLMKNNNQQAITTHRTMTWNVKAEDYIRHQDENYAFTNDLSYRFNLQNERIRIRTGALLQYNKIDWSERTETRMQFGEEPMSQGRWRHRTEGHKFYSGALQASAEFYKIFNLHLGLRGDNSSLDFNKKLTFSPFVYSDVNIHQALFKNVDWLDHVKIYATYGTDGRMARSTNWTDNWYTGPIQTYPPGDNIVPGYILNPIQEVFDRRMSTFNIGFKSSAFSNRIHIAADWFQSDYLGQLAIPLPASSNYTAYNVLVPFTLRGWRTSIDVDIAQQDSFQWSAGLHVFQNLNVIKNRSVSLNDTLTDSESYLSQLNMKSPQIGMQHFIRAGEWSLALNGYAYLDHPYRQTTMTRYDKTISTVNSSLFALNFMALGYDFGRKEIAPHAFGIRRYRISMVGRNILMHKKGTFTDYLSKSVGISFQAKL